MKAAFALLLLLAFSLLLLLRLKASARSWLFQGVHVWNRWLPAGSALAFLITLLANIFLGAHVRGALALPFLAAPELVLLTIAGVGFLTSYGNLVALATLLYLLARVTLGNADAVATTPGLIVLYAAPAIWAAIGDKVPWRLFGSQPFAAGTRRLLTRALASLALALTLYSLVKIADLSAFVSHLVGGSVASPLLALGVLVVGGGWMTVILARRPASTILLLPALALPTLILLAAATGWPTFALAAPFAIAVALALAAADRRIVQRVVVPHLFHGAPHRGGLA